MEEYKYGEEFTVFSNGEFDVEEKQEEEGLLIDLSPRRKKYRPPAISKQMFVILAIMVCVNVFCVIAIVTQMVQWQTMLLALAVDILLFPVFKRIKNTVDNDELIIFSGTIISIEQYGIKHINYYNVVRVQDEEGTILNFKCQDHKHIIVGNPITFFINKNSNVEETEAGTLIPYITVQYSAYKGRMPEEFDEENAEATAQRTKTIAEYINKI